MFNPIHLYVVAFGVLAILLIVYFRKEIFPGDPKQQLLQLLDDLVPFIDPESTRQVDVITSKRNMLGLSTKARYFKVPDNANMSEDELISFFSHYFDQVFHSNFLYRGMLIDDNTNEIQLLAILELSKGSMGASFIGDPDIVDDLREQLEERFSSPDIIEVTELHGFNDKGEPIINKNQLDFTTANLAHDEFYPWLGDRTIEEYTKEYEASDANGLLFIGPRGTGKTTLFRTMFRYLKREKYILIRGSEVLRHPMLVPWIAAQGNNAAIGIEDSDDVMSARESGNSQMSGILGQLDGVIPTQTKVMFASNLEDDGRSIDSALMREGRNFDTVKFGILTPYQANLARAALGLEPIPDEFAAPRTLTKALHWKPNAVVRHEPMSFGFNGGIQISASVLGAEVPADVEDPVEAVGEITGAFLNENHLGAEEKAVPEEV